jgi:hypothetical protein
MVSVCHYQLQSHVGMLRSMSSAGGLWFEDLGSLRIGKCAIPFSALGLSACYFPFRCTAITPHLHKLCVRFFVRGL